MLYRKRSLEGFVHFSPKYPKYPQGLYIIRPKVRRASQKFVLRPGKVYSIDLQPLQHQVSILSQAIDVLVFRPAKSWQLNRDTKTFTRLNQSLALPW